jgi:hypothetical protein
MMRQMRVVGLSLAMALLLSAVAVSAAQASGRFGINTGEYPANVVGTPSGESLIVLPASPKSVSCSGTAFTGTMASAAAALQLSPSYSGCTGNAGSVVTVRPNGCTFSWTVTSSGGAGTDGVNCPAGKEFEILTYANEAQQKAGVTLCVYGIGTQGPLSTIGFSNYGSGSSASVAASRTVNFSGKLLSGSSCGLAVGQSGTGSFVGNVSLTATNAADGVAAGLSFSAGGVYLAGKESGEAAQQPRIESELGSESLAVVANQTSQNVLSNGTRSIACSGSQLSGTVAGSVKDLSLAAVYSGCYANGGTPATVGMNSCHYTLHVLNAGPPYAGSMDVACGKEGDAIEATIFASAAKQAEGIPQCVYRIAPQTGLQGIGLETLGTGVGRGVGIGLNLKGIASTVSVGTKGNCGTTASGFSYAGNSTLLGA